LREEVRVFRLDRILGVKQSQDLFERPAAFDARGFVLDSLARTPGVFTFELLIHAPLLTVQEMIPSSMAVLESAGAKTLMRCYTDDPHWLARYLTRLELQFTVLENDELRDALATLAQDILDNLRLPD
jgi:predicted DNA-binding transcriptional regulator YafY